MCSQSSGISHGNVSFQCHKKFVYSETKLIYFDDTVDFPHKEKACEESHCAWKKEQRDDDKNIKQTCFRVRKSSGTLLGRLPLTKCQQVINIIGVLTSK